MTDQVVPEPWHIPRALSNEALRLLTSLPMDEIERRLRMDGPAVPEGRELAAVEGQPSDGEVAKLVEAMREQADDARQYTTFYLLHCAADLLERRALRPIPVSERLPGPEDCQPWPGEPDETHWCWVFVKGSLGDDAWERRPVTCLTAYRSIHTHWLPAHALPEVK